MLRQVGKEGILRNLYENHGKIMPNVSRKEVISHLIAITGNREELFSKFIKLCAFIQKLRLCNPLKSEKKGLIIE